jgi:hypothetical protein
MTFRLIPTAIVGSVLLAFSGAGYSYCSPASKDPVQDFKLQLQKIAAEPSDSCTPPSGKVEDLDKRLGENEKIVSSVFGDAADALVAELNATPAGPKPIIDRATAAMKTLEQQSAEINAGWPDESRFHYQILDIPPALVLKVTFRARARFFVFGVPEDNKWNPDKLWRQVGCDEESVDHPVSFSRLDVYPLHRGPSGRSRFLASIGLSGCAGSGGIVYDGREWNPSNGGNLEQIIKLEGSMGMDEGADGRKPTKKDPFAPVGILHTDGPLITLPFCWFSSIDTWDNPSMCAVDTYDISKDEIRFRSRTYNRPDLLPIAKAIEYAEKHDYPAVLAYCTSDAVAQRLIREIPFFVFAGDLQITRKGEGKEHVEMEGYRFDLEKRGHRWFVSAFGIN